MKNNVRSFGLVLFVVSLFGCAHQEESRTLAIPKVASASQAYNGPRSQISVGKFDNRSSFMRGVFSDGVDRLGGQAQTILVTHLQQSRRFSVLDRTNMTEIKEEAAILSAPIEYWPPGGAA
jgi:curli biogenesis system outer membrane secretion channel CsgG